MDCRDEPGNDTEFDEKTAHTMITAGWDLGGANVKIAIVEDGVVVRVAQVPCPAIQDRAKFGHALDAAMAFVPEGARHAVTMTGELSDVFATRKEGVAYLTEAIVRSLLSWPGLSRPSTASLSISIYAGPAGILAPSEAAARWREISSANWHATATLIGRLCGDGLLVDIGTTTTDLIPIRDGACAARGFTDAERLATGELVYTGVVRTPVMAVARRAGFAGVEQGLAAERFATMADVYRLTGDLPDLADDHPTPDGAGKSAEESAARLARMTGRDLADAPMDEWVALARFLAERQLDEIAAAIQCFDAAPPFPALPLKGGGGSNPALDRLNSIGQGSSSRQTPPSYVASDGAPGVPSPLEGEGQGGGFGPIIVGAGCGRFLARRLAERLGHPYTDFRDLIDVADDARNLAAVCAPAVAVALLMSIA